MRILVSFTILALTISCAKQDIGPTKGSIQVIQKRFDDEEKAKVDPKTAGGQPGKILVYGAVIKKETQKPYSNIQVIQKAGLGKNGTYPKLTAELGFSTIREVPPEESKKTYLNLGCDLSIREKGTLYINGYKRTTLEKSLKFEHNNYSLLAGQIYICGKFKVPVKDLFIMSSSLYLKNAEIEVIGTSNKKSEEVLEFSVAELIITGKNKIVSIQPDASSTTDSAPTLWLDIYRFIGGSGTLSIESYGANYKP